MSVHALEFHFTSKCIYHSLVDLNLHEPPIRRETDDIQNIALNPLQLQTSPVKPVFPACSTTTACRTDKTHASQPMCGQHLIVIENAAHAMILCSEIHQIAPLVLLERLSCGSHVRVTVLQLIPSLSELEPER